MLLIMILTSNMTKIRIINYLSSLLLTFAVWVLFALPAYAQEAITISVSPTLYDMAAEPGQVWNSSIKVVNVNAFDLTVYADVVNFLPQGEGGDGRFVPIDENDRTGATIAEWFTISREAIVIPREQTVEVPFTVSVPADAGPGGHYAAILIGTRPLAGEPGQSKLQTAQVITSLFFARIAGEINEAGLIREFSTTESILSQPEATFSLRFQNQGNVHLRPQGEIKILNMWGEERGLVPINQFSNFGNVLPQSIRELQFTWRGEWSIADIGRYTAIATLAYGTDERQFASAETTFWLLPLNLLFWIVVGLVVFVTLMSWLIRLYVRRMLSLAGVRIEDYQQVQNRAQARSVKLQAPVQAGILDLSNRMQNTTSWQDRIKTMFSFVFAYRLFFLGLLLSAGFLAMVGWYASNALVNHRPYEVTYFDSTPTEGLQKTSEEIIYEQLNAANPDTKEPQSDLPKVAVVNRSGVAGLGARARLLLEANGYQVVSLEADFTEPQKRTVIVVDFNKYETIVPLSSILGNALVSARASVDETAPITIFVGEDFAQVSTEGGSR